MELVRYHHIKTVKVVKEVLNVDTISIYDKLFFVVERFSSTPTELKNN